MAAVAVFAGGVAAARVDERPAPLSGAFPEAGGTGGYELTAAACGPDGAELGSTKFEVEVTH